MSVEKVIRFLNVSKIYEKNWLGLHNVTFDISKGDFVFIVGPSGSGKTTLLQLVYFALLPDEGKIEVLNHSSDEITYDKVIFLRRRLGIVFQDFRLLNDKTVFENIEIPLLVRKIKRKERKSRVQSLITSMGLTEKWEDFPYELSGGERQRVAIARAMANQPLILLADEPTGNLDPETSQEIMDLLMEINRMGTTVLMATHNVDIVQQYNNLRVLEFADGDLINP